MATAASEVEQFSLLHQPVDICSYCGTQPLSAAEKSVESMWHAVVLGVCLEL
jgi:hypothetical protein